MRLAEALRREAASCSGPGGALTLLELNGLVRGALESAMDGEYWVEGELLDGGQGYGGHFYGELVQKGEDGQSIAARARVNCWARTYAALRARLESETGRSLAPGMRVRLLVRVTFHEQYGYSLNIRDADTAFVLGDLALRRRRILARLEADGVLEDNRSLPLPPLVGRVAVVSSAGAAGYGDFCHQLLHNEYGLRFEPRLFPAVMQGPKVPESVIAALEAVLGEGDGAFDVAVIIRGGGATGDLSDFDSYPLAACLAQYPIPVVTGIGHERDETVLDRVAHTSVKTPTAAAAFLIARQARQAERLDDLQRRVTGGVTSRLALERGRLERREAVLPLAYAALRQRLGDTLETLARRVASACAARLEREGHALALAGQRLGALDPALLLRRGYSIATCRGRAVRSPLDVRPGDTLTVRVEKGTIQTTVTRCEKE